MKKLLALAGTLLLSAVCYADQIAVSDFKGINNNDNSAILSPEYAQDALNVDVTPGGKSIRKRPGYGIFKTLATTKNLHGGYHFFDSSGNDVQVWGSSTSLYGIVSDGTPTLLSSATLNSTWDCTDTQGSAYCVNSNKDALIKTDGATMTYYKTVLGTMVESTPDRLVVAGVAGNLSTIYHSAANNFVNYTVGPLNSDAFTEPIAAPGSKLTHLRWGCGKLLWWKDQSFGYETFDDQYALQIKIVSDNIGTFDNTSAIDPGGNVWFRGQDGHIWRYDCSGLTKESIEISPFVQASGRRTANFWTQSSQSDFQSGVSLGTSTISTTILPGDLIPSSFTVSESGSGSGWGSGTSSNMAIGTSSITLATNNSGDVNDNSFENGVGSAFSASWTTSDNSGCIGPCVTILAGGVISGHVCGTLNAKSGSSMARLASLSDYTLSADILSLDESTTYASTTFAYVRGLCTWTSKTISATGFTGRRVKFRFRDTTSGNSFKTANSYILGGDITFWVLSDETGAANARNIFVDLVTGGSSTITTGSFTSQVFNTGLPYSYVYPQGSWTVNTSTPQFVLQRSPNGTGSWADVTISTGVNVQSSNQYLRYVTTITVASGEGVATSITNFSILARSSGTYYSQVKNAANLSAWSTFNPTFTDNGDDINFYTRSSANSFTTLSSTPVWVAQTPGALVSANTGVYFQVIASFTVTAASNTPSSIQDFTVNWFDGTATDQAYMLYFDNAIWASVAYGVGVSSNTYIFKRDLINDGWMVYNFGAGGMLAENTHLFFGDVADTGRIYQYDSGTSDNTNPINAYWRSKSFSGGDPFLENQYTQIDSILARNDNQSVTASYTLNNSTSSTSFTIPLSSSTYNLIRYKKQLPNGKIGGTIDLQYGDNTATSQWELMGYRIGFTPLPYRPTQ